MQYRDRTSDRVERELARLLLGLRPGEPIPTVRQLATSHETSLGTIHAALEHLEQAGAVTIQRRGRLGAYVQERSIGRLWAIAESGPLVIALPLVSTPRIEGLATGLKRMLTQAGIETFLIFVRGSRQRLEALRIGKCHVAVMSAFAAAELCSPDYVKALDLPAHTYTAEHRVFLVEAAVRADRPLRVIVDRDSVDQQRLTELEFRKSNVAFIQSSYVRFARELAEGRADAGVWTLEEMVHQRPSGVIDRPLSEHLRLRIGDTDTRAALIIPVVNHPVHSVITQALNGDTIARIQQDVMESRIVPEY